MMEQQNSFYSHTDIRQLTLKMTVQELSFTLYSMDPQKNSSHDAKV